MALTLSKEDSKAIQEALQALPRLAQACAQQPDTDATVKALKALRHAALAASEMIHNAEFSARMERLGELNRRTFEAVQ